MHSEFLRLARDFGWNMHDYLRSDSQSDLWFTSGAQDADSVYADTQWLELDQRLENGWWTRVRNEIISDVLQNHEIRTAIWDCGGGTGIVTRHLNESGFETLNVEPSRFAAAVSTERGVSSICASLEDLNLPNECLGAVSMFDVLEHLPNRSATLGEIRRVLMPSGQLLLTVPAARMLWSQHDVELGHYCRFNRVTIRRELSDCGFEVVRSGYFFALTVVPLFLIRVIPFRLGLRKTAVSDSTLSSTGGLVGRIAGWLERRLALRTPIGSSLIVIARKSSQLNSQSP